MSLLRSRVSRILLKPSVCKEARPSHIVRYGTGLSSTPVSRTYAAADGLKFLGRSGTRIYLCGSSPAFSAALIRAMHWSASSRPSLQKIKRIDSKTFRSFKRLYSGGPSFLDSRALWILIGANVAVFAMWQYLDYRFMQKHFMVSIDSVLSGRIYTIFTSAFSQADTGHLLSNMIGLYFMGSQISSLFGGKYLSTLYLVGAIGGSLGHMLYVGYVYPWLQGIPSYFYNRRYTPGALGASGAVTSVMLLFIFLYPKHLILFDMFIPMPAALMGAIIIGRDLWSAKQGNTDVSVGGHLGGAMVALLAFLAKRSYRL